MSYKINILKNSENNWLVNIEFPIGHSLVQTTSKGFFLREAIINCLESFKKREYDESMSNMIRQAIRDLESML